MSDRLSDVLRLWFTFEVPVRRLPFALSGIGLAVLKYLIDRTIVMSTSELPWPLTSYLHPFYAGGSGGVPFEVPVALVYVTIPFLYVGASLTARRCLDAGLPAILSLFFFLPALNYLLFAALCTARSASDGPRASRTRDVDTGAEDRLARRAFLSVTAGVVLALGMLLLSTTVLERYGLGLFVGTPFVMGALSAYLFNRPRMRSPNRTAAVVAATLACTLLTLLVFALEGAVCLAMAAPPAAMLAFLGALTGRSLAKRTPAAGASVASMLVVLPLFATAEAAGGEPPLREVMTSVVIEAPPEEVWPHVLGFPELPPPRHWAFHLGIAHPLRAHIEGEGVGAVRSCEFSTGAFVEPITAWEPPHRLAFDVRSQPEPMREMSPYSRVHAPHLVDGLVSKRGEFRLVRLESGGTRLEGSTWYTLSLWPQWYWRLWSDAIIHRIHLRVLEHVKEVTLRGI